MLRSKFGICLAATLLAGTIFAPISLLADGPHPKRKDEYKHQVEKLEEIWRTAQISGDVTAMDKLLSDDYVGITMTGQVVTKMQQLDRLQRRSLVLNKIDLDDMKVKIIGTTAIVTSLAEVDGTNDGTPMHGTFRSTTSRRHASVPLPIRRIGGLGMVDRSRMARLPRNREFLYRKENSHFSKEVAT
jgi:ketosteroid isomerase-like protein